MKKNTFNILCIICILLISGLPEHVQGASQKQFTVVIDAGHGGNDPGAIGRRGREKNINLNVALKLGRLIENNCNNTRVVYTRKKDIFVPLHTRAEIAITQKPTYSSQYIPIPSPHEAAKSVERKLIR